MASLRKASAYSKNRARIYTRKSGVRKKAFIKTVPGSKIVKFHMGNQKDFNSGKHKYAIKYVSSEKVQIRDNALEACRMLLNKILDREIPGQYFFQIKVYPHNILRENKTAAGAGADRLSSGMKHSFGVTIGRAAVINPGKELFFVTTADKKTIPAIRKAVSKVKPKIPCKGKVVFEELK
jgi:large subunit ribosomal protein L10e